MLRHQNSLGQVFLPVPGTAVLFAVTETTVTQFAAFLKASRHEWAFVPHFPQEDDHAVVGVNLQDALAFCTWLTESERANGKIAADQSYRLPVNDEWSAAAGLARARKRSTELTAEETLADQQRFPWGLRWPPPANAANLAERDIPGYDDPFEFTAPVGKFTPTADGLHDLAGNVWEWVWDAGINIRPKSRLRGGSWAYFNEECLRSSYEYEVPADLRASTIGFRVVFEDRARSASLLAAADRLEANPALAGIGLSSTAADSQSSAEELAAMRQRLAAGGDNAPATADANPNPADLKPAQAGARHVNTLGMALIPLPSAEGRVLLGENEVSAREFEAFLATTNQGWPDKPQHISTPAHPAAGISWQTAAAFCEWLTRSQQEAGLIPASARYRLPTDLEWSAAAGLDSEEGSDPARRDGKNDTHFPWDGDWPPPPRAANLDASKIPGFDDPHAYTCAVASNNTNARGFRELGGNVAEWCLDEWPDKPGDRVYRGGSWLSSERAELLTAKRHHAPPDALRGNIGFRCALELPAAATGQ